jgi:hypothetical protein
MRVLNAGQYDIAGDGIRTKQAFIRHAADWTYDVTAERERVYAYPIDQPWSRVGELALAADVLHVRNTFAVPRALGIDAPAVIHHHGTIFRRNRDALLRETAQRNALGLAATLDLWLMAPNELEWLPAPYDLDWLGAMRRPSEGKALRVGHAPTSRAIKSTDAFLSAVEKLAVQIPVEVVLIEGRTWADCLALKATCDVYFDQVLLGYGNNAVESWGMGIPVVAGAADDTLEEMARRFGSLPFVQADEGSIYEALLILADPDERRWWAKRGVEHVNQWHDELRVVQQLQQVYERAAR